MSDDISGQSSLAGSLAFPVKVEPKDPALSLSASSSTSGLATATVSMDHVHAHSHSHSDKSSSLTPPSAQRPQHASTSQQHLPWADRAPGLGHVHASGTGSSASTIRPEFMNAPAHGSVPDFSLIPAAAGGGHAFVDADAPGAVLLPHSLAHGLHHQHHLHHAHAYDHARAAPAYTPSAILPRSSSMSMAYTPEHVLGVGANTMAYHSHSHHHHFALPPVPPPRHSSLSQIPQSAPPFGHRPPQSPELPDRVPALQITQPTPTKRKTRARPASTASQATAMPHDDPAPAESSGSPSTALARKGSTDGAASQAMSTESSADSIPDDQLSPEELAARKKDRARYKGRIRQQRKRLRDKLAKQEQESRKANSMPSRNPSAPNLLMGMSAASSYASIPQSASFYQLSPNNSFAFSSSTSLSGQSSPSVAFSPIIGTAGLYSPGTMTPNEPYSASAVYESDPFASAAGGSGGISFRPRSSRGRTAATGANPRPTLQMRRTSHMSIGSIDTSHSSASASMSVPQSGPRTAPLPMVGASMDPPPFKRRKSEPEPEEFRQDVGLGMMMGGGPSQSWPLLSTAELGEKPSWDRADTSSSSTGLPSETGSQDRSPTPPPLMAVPAVLPHQSHPASPGQTFASLILSACTDATLAEKLERQLNLGQDALGSLQSGLADVYDKWAAAHKKRPSIETSFPSTSSFTSVSGSTSAHTASTSTSLSTSPTSGMYSSTTFFQHPQPMSHIGARGGKDLIIDPALQGPGKDDSPANSALQTPNTGQAYQFSRAQTQAPHTQVETPVRQQFMHSQTDPDMRRMPEGAWLRGQTMQYALESPLAMAKARPRSRPGSHRSTQSQSTIRAPVPQAQDGPLPVSPTQHMFPLPTPEHQPLRDSTQTFTRSSVPSPAGPAQPLSHGTSAGPAYAAHSDNMHFAQTMQPPFTPTSVSRGRDSGFPAHYSPATPIALRSDGTPVYATGPYATPIYGTPQGVQVFQVDGAGVAMPLGPVASAGPFGAPLMPIPMATPGNVNMTPGSHAHI